MTGATAYQRDLLGVAALIVAAVAAAAWIGNSYYLTLLTYAALYAVAALGLFLLFGYAGQISLAQGAFFGMGAYVSAYLTTRVGVPSAVAMIAAALMPAALGWLVSRQLLRLSTNYLAMATLAFGSICSILFGQLRSLTGGLDPGIIGVPPFSLFGYRFEGARGGFMLTTGVLVLATLVTVNLIHSRIGRNLRALRSSEFAAAGLGIDVVHHKVVVFAIAAGMTGIGGALFAHVQTTFNASAFSAGLSIELLLMVVIGSVFTPWGALVGALFVTVLPAFLDEFEQFKLLIYGTLMAIVMIFMPDGLGKALMDGLLRILRRTRAI